MDNLKAHTGIETILYATHGSTDLPLQGITFNTEGVDNFMESVIGVSAEDFVGKMEGFAVQGVQGDLSSFPSGKNNVYNHVCHLGAAKNHQQQVTQLRSSIREVINRKLRK